MSTAPVNPGLTNQVGTAISNLGYMIQQKIIPTDIDATAVFNPNQLIANIMANVGTVVGKDLLPLVIILGIGLLIGIFMSIFGCCFCLCRCCCNGCGGRRPKKHGYTAYQTRATSFFMLLFSACVIFGGSIVIIFGYQFATDLLGIFTSIDGVFTSFSAFQDQVGNGATDLITLITNSINKIPSAVTSVDFVGIINVNLWPSVLYCMNTLQSIGSSLSQIKTNSASIQTSVTTMSGIVSGISVNVNNIRALLANGSTTTILGVSYPITGLPSVPVTNLQDPSGSISFSSINSQLSTLPNITSLVLSINSTYTSAVGGITGSINGSLTSLTSSITGSSSYTALTGTLGSTLNSTVRSISVSTYQKWIDENKSQIVNNTPYIGMGFAVIAGILMFAYAFAIVGVLLQRGVLVQIVKPVSIICMFLIWILFVIMFLLAFAFAVAYTYKPDLLSHSFDLGATPSDLATIFGGSNSTEIILVPGLIISSCSSGSSLLNATVNNNNDSTVDALGIGNFFHDTANKTRLSVFLTMTGVQTQLDSLSLGNAISLNFPSYSGFGNLNNINFNISSLSSINTSLPFDVQATISSINNVSSNLSPQTFNSSFTPLVVPNDLDSFNTFALSVNASFVNYTTSYVISQYIVGSNTFDASVITGAASGSNNNQLTTLFNRLYTDVLFERTANTAVAALQQQYSGIITNLRSVNQSAYTLTTSLAQVVTQAQTLTSYMNTTFSSVQTLLTYQNSTLKTTIQYTIDAAKNASIDAVLTVLADLQSSMIDELNTITVCKGLTDSVSGLLASLIDGLLFDFDGLSMGFFFVGIGIFAGFIVGVKASKRLGVHRKIFDKSKK